MSAPDQAADDVRRALLALSAIASSREGKTLPGTIPLDWFRWLALSNALIMDRVMPGPIVFGLPTGAAGGETYTPVHIERELAGRLAAVDQLRPGRHHVHLGWLFVAGTTTDEAGRPTKLFWPLVTMPLRVSVPPFGGAGTLSRAGDTVVTSRMPDARRWELEGQLQFGGGALDASGVAADPAMLRRLTKLLSFARSAASACGWEVDEVVPAGDSPHQLMQRDGLVIVAGLGLYTNTEAVGLSSSATLDQWAATKAKHWTAFHALYADRPDPPTAEASSAEADPESPFLLTPAQRDAVVASRDQPVTVIRGAPGTGKSHTITAIACDALARGETVLVAARSEATVAALIDLFERAPGPQPVVFGSNEHKDALAERLAGGLVPASTDDVRRAREQLDEAVAWRRSIHDATAEALMIEQLSADADPIDTARAAWPALFEPTFDLDAAGALVERAAVVDGGWWARRRQRKARVLLCEQARTTPERWDALVRALTLARLARAIPAQAARSGPLIPRWDELLRADDRVRELAARTIQLDSRSLDRLDRRAHGAIAALATALRSGRAARRQQLSRMDDDLTRALPLWVGTLADVDDLLPPIPALFDVVILDEASSIDQPSAATTLLRGGRAVVVGDPQQLRHVSFLGDDDRDRALVEAGVDLASPLAARLDVRRNSAFDLAAGTAPAITLDEHFRCDPHLFDLVAARLYGGRVAVATRSPATASVDCVEVRRVAGQRDGAGVVREEVAAVLVELDRLRARGARSVGVITPFRAQADALEQAILDRFDAGGIDALDLRVGTVHAFQGNERDVVIVSLGLGSDAPGASWRFAEDPHLFAVMATRARRQLIIVHAADPPPGGLLEAWLARADAPPGPPDPVAVPDPWTNAVARSLADTGAPFISAYPTGHHLVDVCVGDARRFFGVECAVHPDGPGAHIDRHLALVRRGWTLLEGYPSRWADRHAELAVELANALDPPA